MLPCKGICTTWIPHTGHYHGDCVELVSSAPPTGNQCVHRSGSCLRPPSLPAFWLGADNVLGSPSEPTSDVPLWQTCSDCFSKMSLLVRPSFLSCLDSGCLMVTNGMKSHQRRWFWCRVNSMVAADDVRCNHSEPHMVFTVAVKSHMMVAIMDSRLCLAVCLLWLLLIVLFKDKDALSLTFRINSTH